MIIELDMTLKINEQVFNYNNEPIDRFLLNNQNKNTQHIQNNIPENSSTTHNNYLEYLELCWGSHLGVVLTPDIVWYTLLCELCQIIAEKPETYRSLFTNAAEGEGKKEISVFTNDVSYIPLESVMDQLRTLIPNGFTNVFLPEFTTSTKRSSFAHAAAFADTVSPYYSYSTYCCGLRQIDVRGTKEDWVQVYTNWNTIIETLTYLDKSNIKYFSEVSSTISNIPKLEPKFFKEIFRAERCGSGSQTELFGWFTDLFRVQPEGVRKSCNFATHVSVVNYKNLDTNQSFVMKNGLFSSKLVADNLEPDFAHIIYQIASQSQ